MTIHSPPAIERRGFSESRSGRDPTAATHRPTVSADERGGPSFGPPSGGSPIERRAHHPFPTQQSSAGVFVPGRRSPSPSHPADDGGGFCLSGGEAAWRMLTAEIESLLTTLRMFAV